MGMKELLINLKQPCPGPGQGCRRVKKLLPPPFMGEVARWIRAKPGAAGSEGVSTFQRKVDISEYLLRKYSDSPRPSGTPLINAGGKIDGFQQVNGRAAFAARPLFILPAHSAP